MNVLYRFHPVSIKERDDPSFSMITYLIRIIANWFPQQVLIPVFEYDQAHRAIGWAVVFDKGNKDERVYGASPLRLAVHS